MATKKSTGAYAKMFFGGIKPKPKPKKAGAKWQQGMKNYVYGKQGKG